MDNYFSDLGRCISILDRLMKMYYNHGLEDYEIGWGQQFYVEYIYDHPGASAQEMAECIRVDKATLTKVIKKLNNIGYIRVIKSEDDKRIRHLYLTDKAVPAARRIKEIHNSFFSTLYACIPLADIQQTEQIMKQMVKNVSQKVWHRMEEHHGE